MKNKNYNKTFLNNIQGNILQPHGRIHARHLFLSFKKRNKKDIRQWIQNFTNKYITSAWDELSSLKEGLFCSFLLSSNGYAILNEMPPTDEAFNQGMKKRGFLLNDIDHNHWDEMYQTNNIDALLIIADNNPVNVAQKSVLIKESLLNSGLNVITEEQGIKLMRYHLEIEHFGFVDGISQPENKPVKFSKKEKIIAPNSILVKDPYKKGCFGSLFVFRKLEQNVFLWEENIQKLARELGEDPFLAGAYTMGRFKDSTPVVKSKEMKWDKIPQNNFDYNNDSEGAKCPLHAHARRMNWREKGNCSPRIARRGMSYGVRPDLHEQGTMFPLPKKGVGLLFMCYQKNIADGFEYLQQLANEELDSGQDPVISQGKSQKIINLWPKSYGAKEKVSFSFDRAIRLKGGEYFFAPSIEFLKFI